MVDSYSYESRETRLPVWVKQGLPVTVNLKKEKVMNINEFVEEVKDGITIVDFWAEWCGPCKMVSPVLDEIATETGAKLLKINVDEDKDLAAHFNISGIPAMMVYSDGEKIRDIVGAKPKPALKKALFG